MTDPKYDPPDVQHQNFHGKIEDAQMEREWLRVTLASIGDAVLATDSAGKIVFLNAVAAGLTGWTENEATGRPASEVFRIVNEKTGRPATDIVSRVLREGRPLPLANHTALVSRDGRIIPVEDSAAPIRSAEGKVLGVVLVFHDVTEQRRSQEKLREQADLLQLAFDAIFVWNVNGEIVSWNLGAERLYGYSNAEAIGRPVHDLLATVFPKPWHEIHGELLRSGSWEGELLHRARDGREIAVSSRFQLFRASNGSDRVLEITRDITGRKRAVEALRASQASEHARAAELQAILDAAPVAILVAQDAECRGVIGSRAAYEMLRVPLGSNLSKSALEELPSAFKLMRDGREIPLEELPAQKAALSGKPVRNFEFDLVFDDGGSRTVIATATPLFDEEGRPRGSVGVLIDITERKRNEERLRQAQKLESIGLLAGGIAHDFNNLLTGILGNASMMLDEVPPESAEHIRDIVAAAERAAHLTRQLLAYAGKGQFVTRDLDVSQAVQEVGDLVQFSIPKSVQLSIAVEKRLPAVRMDPAHLQQILMNLVINAGEAIGEGNPGRITVATSMRDVEAAFVDASGGEVEAGRYVCVSISDTGSGIPADALPKIFDPFFSTRFTGRGLGLAAVAGIVRSLKGGITVESKPGAGTTFDVLLPASGARERITTLTAAAEGRATILVVDDERSVRDFIGAVLTRRGYRVITASDGREALEICERADGKIDAAILDVIMPVLGASELLPELKRLQPEIKVLLTSGYSEAEARRLCAAYPGSAFIQKPYTAQQIAEALRKILE